MPARLLRALPVGALLLVPVLALLGRLALFAGHGAAMLAFPWQIDFDEGVILHGAWLLAQGHTPYPPLAPDRFISSVYPPLFYALNAIPLQIWGLNLWSGRALSLIGALLAAGAIAAWTWAETRAAGAGGVAAALWLALGPVIVWATFYKQDVLALGFEASGAALLAVALRPGARARWTGGGLPLLAWLAIGPLVLAVGTKQSALPALGACALWLLWRDPRRGLRWTLAAAVVLGGAVAGADLALGGGLLTHLFLPNAEALTLDRLGKNAAALWTEHWPLIVLAAAAAGALALAAWRVRRPPALSLLFAALSLPAALWTNLSPLANYNHLLPLLLPLCLLVGVGLGHALAYARERGRVAWAWPVAIVVVLLGQTTLFTPLHTWYSPLGQPLDEKAARLARMLPEVAAAPGRTALAEDAWLALQAGKALPFDDPAMLATQAARGRWDPAVFLNDIARRKFGVVILEDDITGATYSPRWTPAMLVALQANYVVKYRDVRFLAVPRPPPAAPPTPLGCTLAGGPALLGLFLPGGGTRLDSGDVQAVSLYWGPQVGTPRPDLKVSLRLIGPDGGLAWQADVPPGATAGFPWPAWAAAGPGPRDDFQVAVPADAAPGAYRLMLAAYTTGGAPTAVPFHCADRPDGDLTLAQPAVAAPLEVP